jgi:hypothetical protein
MPDPNDRFGTPDSAFSSASASHGADNPCHRMDMYVPTRHEVATLPVDRLSFILDF